MWLPSSQAFPSIVAGSSSASVHAAASPVFTELIAAADVLIGETLIATGLDG
jgi:hypothetical protein